jgi:hypothetical protein
MRLAEVEELEQSGRPPTCEARARYIKERLSQCVERDG